MMRLLLNVRKWALAARPLLGFALPIGNAATWWKAVTGRLLDLVPRTGSRPIDRHLREV
jgi:hypothetical protein